MKRFQLFGAAASLAAAAALLWKTREVAQGVRSGLLACAGTVIPSLFPFMVLAGLIGSTGAGDRLSRMVSLGTRRLLRLPEALGGVLLMSFLGGFPVGARMLSYQLERGRIDARAASRALCFCVNAGPSFVISAVGASMLGSLSAGLVLLGAQVLSALCVCAFLCRREPDAQPPRPPRDGAGGFVEAVRGASAGMLSICAFVTLFSAISALLGALGVTGAACGLLARLFPSLGRPFFEALLTGILEVTGGCQAAAALHNRAGFLLCAFLVSFSSLSISFQVQSCFARGSGVRFTPYYLSRLAHGGLTCLFAALGWRLLPPEALSAALSTSRPVPQAAPHMLVSSLCLVCMCTILVGGAKDTGGAGK